MQADILIKACGSLQHLADGLKETVDAIEAETAVTRNRYDKYMMIFSMIATSASERQTLAKALILAGANRQGVADALRVS